MLSARDFLTYLMIFTSRQLSVTSIPDSSSEAIDHVLEQRDLACDTYVDVLNLLVELGESATAFCSSYLHIPSVTTVPGPTVTPDPSTYTDFITTTDFFSSTLDFPAIVKEKRSDAPVHGVTPRAIPAALTNLASEEISGACSCLYITPRSTYTETITAPTPVVTVTDYIF